VRQEPEKRTTNSKPIPHIPLPLKEVMKELPKVDGEGRKSETGNKK